MATYLADILPTQSTGIEPSEVTTVWTLDASHSQAQFKVRHMMITNVTGEFGKIEGELGLNTEDIGRSYVEATIETASINTRDEGRDAHLRSADFFDVENHPTMTFRSKRFVKKANGDLAIVGDLTIRETTKEVTLDVEGPTPETQDPWGNTRIGLSATTKINRKDFGLHWNAALEAGGVLVGEEVKITLEAQFVKKS